jgi:uncharacterized protein YuzE
LLQTARSKNGISVRLTDESWAHIAQTHAGVAMSPLQDFVQLVPALKDLPQHLMWASYDAEADVLYVNFKKPSRATDSELGDDDVIVRKEGDEIIGYTILHASKREK